MTHPFACRCYACRKARPVGYVHGATAEDVDRHIRLIRDQERLMREQKLWRDAQ